MVTIHPVEHISPSSYRTEPKNNFICQSALPPAQMDSQYRLRIIVLAFICPNKEKTPWVELELVLVAVLVVGWDVDTGLLGQN